MPSGRRADAGAGSLFGRPTLRVTLLNVAGHRDVGRTPGEGEGSAVGSPPRARGLRERRARRRAAARQRGGDEGARVRAVRRGGWGCWLVGSVRRMSQRIQGSCGWQTLGRALLSSTCWDTDSHTRGERGESGRLGKVCSGTSLLVATAAGYEFLSLVDHKWGQVVHKKKSQGSGARMSDTAELFTACCEVGAARVWRRQV